MGEIETEEESTEGSIQCPHCYTRYYPHNNNNNNNDINNNKCDHLLCEVFYAESNNVFLPSPNCPIVATLFGEDVPRVVAMRFLRYMREGRVVLDVGEDEEGDNNNKDNKDNNGDKYMTLISTLKFCIDKGDYFMEWTYFFTLRPHRYITTLESFVKKIYCDRDIQGLTIPFSRLQSNYNNNNIMVLNIDNNNNNVSNINEDNNNNMKNNNNKMRWIMVSGFPDGIPIFLFPIESNGHVLYINKSHNMQKRIQNWGINNNIYDNNNNNNNTNNNDDLCVRVNQLVTLPTYLVN